LLIIGTADERFDYIADIDDIGDIDDIAYIIAYGFLAILAPPPKSRSNSSGYDCTRTFIFYWRKCLSASP
jgi:hypothetical protein